MIDIDETDLVGFFGVLPEDQDPEEKEFFNAPLFVKEVEGLRLSVSISLHWPDLMLDLVHVGREERILGYVLKNIVSIRIEKHPDGRRWLHARTESGASIALSVEPVIEIDIQGTESA